MTQTTLQKNKIASNIKATILINKFNTFKTMRDVYGQDTRIILNTLLKEELNSNKLVFSTKGKYESSILLIKNNRNNYTLINNSGMLIDLPELDIIWFPYNDNAITVDKKQLLLIAAHKEINGAFQNCKIYIKELKGQSVEKCIAIKYIY